MLCRYALSWLQACMVGGVLHNSGVKRSDHVHSVFQQAELFISVPKRQALEPMRPYKPDVDPHSQV